ncbi:MAG: GTP cyclohydrolase [Devosia sp.]|uniref:YciI family protein n=1 Tax=Devosia sp. TaxID=1871048 RepID=UPI0024CA08C8|nr:YciI family protein [Devosia sp.]UYN98228.1 MAG: GTP cyclohydrolase [Devosia sp.]
MFILSLTYLVPLDQVDRHVEPHLAWVAEGYDRGYFLASGRKEPRTGGVILARGPLAELEALTAQDPFVLAGVARYEFTSILVSRTAPGLEALKG